MSGKDSGGPEDASASRAERLRQEALARNLRRIYDEVVSEPVPDDFLGFLKQADERQNAGLGGSGSSNSGSDSDRKDG